MLALGFSVGRMFGWSTIASLFFGGSVAVASTMILAKVLEERPVERELRESIFSLMLFEDLAAMVIIALLTAAATGEGLAGGQFLGVAGRLLGVLVVFLIVGMAVVPRAARLIVRLRNPESMLVSMVGFAFGLSYVAATAGFSVALGAFVGGMLVAESGAGRLVSEQVRPLRDMFAAIFFVATGMQLDLGLLKEGWGLAVALLAVVALGKPVAVVLGVFLSGRGLRSAVRTGLSVAQIGEFSFILIAVGASLGVVPRTFMAATVAVSVVTAFLASWLARRADAIVEWVDRSLPHRVQMVASLYGSWVEALQTASAQRTPWAQVRRSARWLALDALGIVGVTIAGAMVRERLAGGAEHAGPRVASGLVALVTVGMLAPFLLGLLRVTRRLGEEVADIAIPTPLPGKVDNGRAPRRVLGVAVQIGAILVTAGPIILITQPFLPPLSGLLVLAILLGLMGVIFWRRANDLFGHFQAGAELVMATLAKQSRAETVAFDPIRRMLPGLGDFTPVRVSPASLCVDVTLGDANLRGRTGATVVALLRGDRKVVFPEADEKLAAGDLVALTGSHDAIAAAARILRPSPAESP
jgi:CPA2 family monovalent cation:H+ antiporter-2